MKNFILATCSLLAVVGSATSQAPRPLGDLTPGLASTADARFFAIGGRVLIRAVDPVSGLRRLWHSDGTAAGTVQFTGAAIDTVVPMGSGAIGIGPFSTSVDLSFVDLAAGSAVVLGTFPTTVDLPDFSIAGRYVFTADDGTHGAELWVTDGTVAGTRMLQDLVPGPISSAPHGFAQNGGTAMFFAEDPTSGQMGIWETDGVTVRLLGTTSEGQLRSAAVIGGRLFFAHQIGSPPRLGPMTFEVFDPRIHVTSLPLLTSSYTYVADRIVPLGDLALFSFDMGNMDNEPFVSDGTLAGTGPILDLNPAGTSSPVFHEVSLDGLAVFEASVGGARGLWGTDGTAAGTRILTTYAAAGGTYATPLVEAGEDLLLLSSYHSATREWSVVALDGAGASPVLSGVAPGVVHNGLLFHRRDDGVTGTEPWVIDLAPLALSRGQGAGIGSRVPTLSCSAPRLGHAARFSGTNAPVGQLGALAFGLAGPAPSPLGGGSFSLLDLGSIAVVHWFTPSPSGDWQWALPLPMFAPLQGLTFGAQAWFGPAATPSGVELSNGLELTLGV